MNEYDNSPYGYCEYDNGDYDYSSGEGCSHGAFYMLQDFIRNEIGSIKSLPGEDQSSALMCLVDRVYNEFNGQFDKDMIQQAINSVWEE